MAIASITQWLTSQDKPYAHGRALYEQYGDNRVTLTLIKSGSSTFHFNKLLAALEELNKRSNLEPKPIVIGTYVPEPPAAPGKKAIDFKDAPDQIAKIREEKTKRYAQARRLFETIRVMDSAEHRLRAGLELLDHMDYVSDAWAAIDEWNEKGIIRAEEVKKQATDVADLTHAQLLKEQALLGPNISKDTKKLEACTDPSDQIKISNRLQQRIVRMEQVRRRLNEFV